MRGFSFRIGETYAVSSLYFHYMLSCEKVKHIKKSHSLPLFQQIGRLEVGDVELDGERVLLEGPR